LRSLVKPRVFVALAAILLMGAVPGWPAGEHGFAVNPAPPSGPTHVVVPRDCGPEFMTQLTSPDLVEAGTSIACSPDSGVTTTENSWARCFNVTDDITVNCVEFGVENCDIEVEISIDIYRDTDGSCPPDIATAELLGSAPVVVPAGTGTQILTADFSSIGGVFVPAGSKMIVDVNVPDLSGIGAFFVGANNNGESADSYIRSSSCGLSDWAAIDTVWTDPVHVVINVDYLYGTPEPGACCLVTGECIPDTLPTDCSDLGGVEWHTGVACEPENPCPQPPIGACCDLWVQCTEVSVYDCAAIAGNWLGADTTCGGDCDGDGTADVCMLALGLAEDCNENGIPDNCDILSGTSCDENGNGIPDECEFRLRGDLNCDGVVNGYDIDPFVVALTDEAAYHEQYPCCNYGNADCNFDGEVNGYDIDAFVTILTGGPSVISAVELAGNPLEVYPYFEYVRAFNVNAPIDLAMDPSRYLGIIGRTADVYVVEKKTPAEWEADPALVDVTAGGAATVTFSGGNIEGNTFEIVGPNELNAAVYQEATGDYTGFGHGYDMIVDLNRNGVLDGGDYIDGLSREAGLYVCHDSTQSGPLAVTDIFYNVGSIYGIPSTCTNEEIYYPTNIASMGELPLLVVSHGNGHDYRWYGHIGNHMASYGYVVMSHQNNTGPGSEYASLTTCGHTDAFIQNMGSIAGGVLVGHVDLHRIIWCGHSRGAEGVAIAFDRITDVPPSYTPAHYTPDDIILVDSMLPVDFNGFSTANPHWANYHLWTASGDGDVSGAAGSDIGQTFHLHERATRYRQSTIVQGTGHAWFHNGPTSPPYFEGPCPINQAGTHLVQLGLMMPMYKHYVEGNIPGQDYIWRQWEHFHPIGVPIPANPCYVVSCEYRNGDEEGTAFIDNYETQTSTTVSSSGGSIWYNVTNLTEGRLDDNNSSFAWTSSDPFNGATQDAASDNFKGVVFDWSGDKYYEWSVVPALQDFSAWKYLGLRGAQGTQHPYTLENNGILTFTITLRDGLGRESSISTGAYGGGFGMPYARQGGWHNEMRRIRMRTTDFRTNGNQINLSNIVAVRLNFGPSWGTPEGRIVIDEMMLDNDVPSFFTPLTMALVGNPPEFLPPHVATSLDVSIDEGDDSLVAGSALLYYRIDGGAWGSTAMTQVGGFWRGTLPVPDCGQSFEYYFAAEGYVTGMVYAPEAGDADPYSSLVGDYNSILNDNFESDLGWTVYSDPAMTSGAWQRAVPVGGDYGPSHDYDGSGRCYVTDNRATYDVDGGPTQLFSPVMDMSAADDPIIRYAEWFFCDDPTPPAQDYFDVDVSSDGANWVQVYHVASHADWVLREFHVADYIPLTATVQVRFTAIDSPNNSQTEAGVDRVEVFDVQCD
jgi:hypothetical protein